MLTGFILIVVCFLGIKICSVLFVTGDESDTHISYVPVELLEALFKR